jgi:hypothetical protein
MDSPKRIWELTQDPTLPVYGSSSGSGSGDTVSPLQYAFSPKVSRMLYAVTRMSDIGEVCGGIWADSAYGVGHKSDLRAWLTGLLSVICSLWLLAQSCKCSNVLVGDLTWGDTFLCRR